jgi:hypothetical protein
MDYMKILILLSERLDHDFAELKAEHLRVLHLGEIERKKDLEGIMQGLKRLEESERSKGDGWWRGRSGWG